MIQAYAALGGQDGTKAKWKELGGNLMESVPVVDAAKRLTNANNMEVTPAQVLLRWAMQRNTIVVPKTSSPLRMKENANIFYFELTEKEMLDISNVAPAVENDGRICWRTEPLRMLDFA